MDASLQSTIAIRHEDNGSRWAENMQHARITNYAEMLCKEAALLFGADTFRTLLHQHGFQPQGLHGTVSLSSWIARLWGKLPSFKVLSQEL